VQYKRFAICRLLCHATTLSQDVNQYRAQLLHHDVNGLLKDGA
jgi:hypothetical protein